MKRLILSSAATLALCLPAPAADQTWSGKISDSMCNEKHNTKAEHGKAMSDRECVLACIQHGGKYVFVSDGKIYSIENQSFGDLQKHAGHAVKLSGELKDDHTIKVSSIVMDKNPSTTGD